MFNPNRVRSSVNARAELPPIPQTMIGRSNTIMIRVEDDNEGCPMYVEQMPSNTFPAMLAKRFPGIVIDSTTEAGYIRVQICCPDDETAKKALTTELSLLAPVFQWTFDGYNEDGYPCFIL